PCNAAISDGSPVSKRSVRLLSKTKSARRVKAASNAGQARLPRISPPSFDLRPHAVADSPLCRREVLELLQLGLDRLVGKDRGILENLGLDVLHRIAVGVSRSD